MSAWKAADLYFDPDTFSGVARLFPLPNLVMYPHVMQPLHIYESRYREMLEDSLATDRLIAMALLEPGWETDYESRPPVAPYACLGKIVTHHKLEDGRYNLLLMGVGRIRIAEEMPPLRSFRQAKVELLREKFVDSAACHIESLQRELLDAIQQHLPCGCQAPEQLSEMFADQLPLSMMTDLASYALPLALTLKQQLLAENRVDVRAQLLLKHFERESSHALVAAADATFPPRFSVN
ncbi:MAG: LON peptidase substrate-binding domain-containing protein [Pirellulales bacterium]